LKLFLKFSDMKPYKRGFTQLKILPTAGNVLLLALHTARSFSAAEAAEAGLEALPEVLRHEAIHQRIHAAENNYKNQ
jgi:hypothetical protein